jgi:hypothetical protein
MLMRLAGKTKAKATELAKPSGARIKGEIRLYLTGVD